jgi:hypothetical protein
LIGFSACLLFLPLGSPCLPVMGYRFGSVIAYLFHNFLIAHSEISLSVSSIILPKPVRCMDRMEKDLSNQMQRMEIITAQFLFQKI